jgi:SAM-dependent methyltransferase/FKBP-type peptidyl-prolyl cis-trans isomerase 2
MRNHSDKMADIEFRLKWNSNHVSHTDSYFGRNINFWRDCFPPRLYEILINNAKGDQSEFFIGRGEFIDRYQEKKVFTIKNNQFGQRLKNGSTVTPRAGRFYPKGLLKDIPGAFPENIEPFRCLAVSDDHITVDFNHPLSTYEMQLEFLVKDVWHKNGDKGGSCADWIETITSGPGMQERSNGIRTDFIASDAFSREDESPDDFFYKNPRMVYHIDASARGVVRELYSKIIKPGMRVLDLMASWESHIDEATSLKELTGLGLNQHELEANKRLTSFHLLDLNHSGALPFERDSFDAVICTSSVEYLTDPVGVFHEVSRILTPGGIFILTFSNRWFPPKVVKIWKEIHEFERVGLVSEYFLRNGSFEDIETFSMRGLPRPSDDKYYPEFPLSDPVFSVWARKKTG